jgi:hypothetical protein
MLVKSLYHAGCRTVNQAQNSRRGEVLYHSGPRLGGYYETMEGLFVR